MNNISYEAELINKMMMLPKYRYTKRDLKQDAVFIIGAILFWGYWLYMLAQLMLRLAYFN